MTILSINQNPIEAEMLIGVDTPEESPPDKAYHNAPFADEVCIQLINPPEGIPNFYIARLNSKADLSKIKEGNSVQIPATTGDQTTYLEGKVLWVDDESPNASYPVDVDIQYGFVVRKEKKMEEVIVDPEEYGIDPERFQIQLLSELGVIEEKKIGRARLESLSGKVSGLGEGVKIDPSRFREILGKIPILGINAPFKHQIVKIKSDVNLVDGRIQLRVLVTPPARIARPVIHFEGEKAEQTSAGAREVLSNWVAEQFEAPLTSEAIDRGIKEIEKKFSENEKFTIARMEDGTPKLAVEYSRDGELIVHLFLTSVPHEMTLNIIEYEGETENTPVRTVNNFSASKLPINLSLPLTEANKQKNVDALIKYYDEQGFIANIHFLQQSEESVQYRVELYHKPTGIRPEYERDIGPSIEWLKENFTENGRFTTRSILKGQVELAKWYSGTYYLRESVPHVRIIGNQLVINAHVSTIHEFHIYYIDGENDEENNIEDAVESRESIKDPKYTFLKEFEQKDKGQVFDRKKHAQALARLQPSKYPFEVTQRIEKDPKTGNISVRVFVRKIPVHDISLRVDSTRVHGEDSRGGSGTVGYSTPLQSGKRVGGSAGYLNDGAGSQVVSLGGFVRIPWIDSHGTSLRIGGGLQYVFDNPGDQVNYYHTITPSAEFDIPYERFHWFGYLLGASTAVSIKPDDGYERTTGTVYGGVRVSRRNISARVTTGLGVSDEGHVYSDSNAAASHVLPLPFGFYTQTDFRAGARLALAKEVPPDSLYHGFSVIPAYDAPDGFMRGRTHAGASFHVLYPLIDNILIIGPGCSALELGGDTRLGCGVKASLAGIELYVTMIDEHGFAYPFPVTLGGGFTF